LNTNPTGVTRPGRAAWLAVGVPLTVAALFFGGLNVLSLLGVQSTVEHHTYRSAITRLDVSVGSGDVQVRRGQADQVTVRRDLTWSYGQPAITQRVDGDTLFLHADCGFWGLTRCSADYTVQAPADVSVRVHTSSGNVTVDGVRGRMDLSTSSGDIDVRDTAGAFSARTGSGSITAIGLDSADVRARTGSGGVELEFRQPPRRVNASTGSGDVDVAVSGHDRYAVTGHTGSGDRVVEVIQDPGADRSIRAVTGSGDVVVRYLGG
jgi:hypothetical protein